VWATAGFVVVVSVLVQGIAATPVMARLDRLRQAHGDRGARPGRGIEE
jgi:NhaP-type Na+/H+ or K+/H+ antiporter